MKRAAVFAIGTFLILTGAVVALLYWRVITSERAAALEVFLVAVHVLTSVFHVVLDLFGVPDARALEQATVGPTKSQRTKWRPFKRYLILLVNVAICVSGVVLLMSPFAPRLTHTMLGEDPIRRSGYAHVLAIVVVGYVVAIAGWYWLKNHAKHRKLLRIEKASGIVARLGEPPQTPGRKELESRFMAVDDLLRHLLMATDNKLLPFVRALGRTYGHVRTAWLLVPTGASGDRFKRGCPDSC